MRLSAILLAGTALSLASPAFAAEQEAPAPAAPTEPDQPHPEQTDSPAPGTAADSAQEQDIVVTARKREESLKDVPVAATAITGETIEKRGLVAVKDVAMLTPGLSINSDGAGRAFVSIRGVGVTLIDSVQPGVGIFLDGIYQPNTSYLNNPLNDVERVEVLRGPQGRCTARTPSAARSTSSPASPAIPSRARSSEAMPVRTTPGPSPARSADRSSATACRRASDIRTRSRTAPSTIS